MDNHAVCILGVPVNTVTLSQTVDQICELIKEKGPHYISTLNVDFLANIHGWASPVPRHPELLNILRKSTLVTADGMPIVWLSKCLRNPIKERVTGTDLIPHLAEALGKKGQSLYLLGGEEQITHEAASSLKKHYPGIKIVGISCPPIIIEGERLIEAEERDSLIVEEINRTAPDVLLLNLGNPKQEIWYQRIQKKLRVPIVIGIGGALNFIAKAKKRAPRWMQSSGLEWLFRLTQEPKRLFLRYLYDTIHFFHLSIPLILYHNLYEIVIKLIYSKGRYIVPKNHLFLSPKKSIAVVRLPIFINKKNVDIVTNNINEAYAQDVIILDFQFVRHLDLYGLAMIINCLMKAERKKILTFGITWQVRILLKLHKVWDLVSIDLSHSPQEAINSLNHHTGGSPLYDAVSHEGDTTILSFFGELDNRQNFERYLQRLSPMLHGKNCLIDFTYCAFIDNSGICFLLELKNLIEKENNLFTIKGLTRSLKKQLRIAGVHNLFKIMED